MKLTKENLNKLLGSLGLQDVEIVDEGGDDFNPDSAIETFLNSKEPVFRSRFETDILPEKIKEVAGQIGGKLRNAIRKASGNHITTKDLEGKTDEEALQALADFLISSKDHSTEEIRKQLSEVVDAHNAEIEKLRGEYEGKLSEQSQRFDDLRMDEYYRGIVGELPLIGDDLGVKADVLRTAIKSKYTPVWDDEKKAVQLREKDNPEKIVLNGNNILDPKAFAQDFFKGLGMVKTDMSKENAADHTDYGNGEGRKTDFSNAQPGLAFQNLKV